MKIESKDYKKLYEEALERAKFLKENTDGVSAKDVSRCFEEIFPELAESGDERIRKALLEHIKGITGWNYFLGISREQMIDWLEKQGEQKYADTPVDNVEPKFKVGDWVVNGDKNPYCIKSIFENHYELYTNEGYEYTKHIKDIDNYYHIWTIQDAKDGDVLTWDDNKCIAIFKEIYDKYSFKGHGGVGSVLGMFLMGGFYDIENAHPATKEQRDFLLQKIKESEYWWDASKTELKKIEKSDSSCNKEDDEVFKAIYEDLHTYYDSRANAFMFSSKKEFYEKKWENAKKWLEKHVAS